ncbi:hypothetical protein D3C75_234720 [compost metagenome]
MLFEGEFTHQRQRHALADPEEAAQEHHHRNDAQHPDPQLIALRHVALPERRHQPRQADGDQEPGHAAQHKTPGLTGEHFAVAGGHGVDQRAVRHVDGGIAYREQQIGAEGPGDFYPHSGVRYGEGQHANNANWHGDPQLPRTKASPAALGAVGNDPHHRVGDGIKYAQGDKQRADQRRG